MQQLPAVRFFCYTRSWRDDAICPLLERMARLPNCRVWFSCDQGTGLPGPTPPSVRIAWLMTAADDLPPPEAALTYRVHRLRRLPLSRVKGVRICPAEDGIVRSTPVTCERCRLCWKSLPEGPSSRLSLPLLGPQSERPAPLP